MTRVIALIKDRRISSVEFGRGEIESKISERIRKVLVSSSSSDFLQFFFIHILHRHFQQVGEKIGRIAESVGDVTVG